MATAIANELKPAPTSRVTTDELRGVEVLLQAHVSDPAPFIAELIAAEEEHLARRELNRDTPARRVVEQALRRARRDARRGKPLRDAPTWLQALVETALKPARRSADPLHVALPRELKRVQHFVADPTHRNYLRQLRAEVPIDERGQPLGPALLRAAPPERANAVPSQAFSGVVAELVRAGVPAGAIVALVAIFAHTDPETAKSWLYRRLLISGQATK